MRSEAWLLRVCQERLGVPGDVRGFGWIVWHLLTHRHTRYVLAWAGAAALAFFELYYYVQSFNDPSRRDGNCGHATIDFGGQYLMGRLLLTGHGRDLYDRTAYWQAAHPGYPPDDPAPPLTR